MGVDRIFMDRRKRTSLIHQPLPLIPSPMRCWGGESERSEAGGSKDQVKSNQFVH